MISPLKRRWLDFWLLAGIIGLWVYWLFLYRTRLLDYSAAKFYLWLLWRNKLPVFLFSLILIIALWCFRKKRWVIGTAIIFLTAAIGCWEYAPDFLKFPPLNPPKIFWQQTPSHIPVALAISYAYSEEVPPLFFLRLQEWLFRKKVRGIGEWAMKLRGQVKEALIGLAEKAGEDTKIFGRCLNLALQYAHTDGAEIIVPLFAEKRYEHVTGQLCWVFGFVKLRQEKVGSSSFWTLYPFANLWVAVRLRFPQKAWPTYLAVEPENAFRGLLLILAIILGYGIFLKILRYAFDRWY